MAGTEGSKYFNIFLDYQVWLTSRKQKGHLSDDLVRLLQYIQREGSLRKAANKLGHSYRKAWGDLREAEEFLGFRLIQTSRGGKGGGMTILTDDGRDLVLAFSELHEQFDEAIYKITKRFFRQLNKDEDNKE